MSIQEAKDEYLLAVKQGQKEEALLESLGRPTNPAVLDELLPEIDSMTMKDLGLMEIPSERIIGTKSAGRISVFTPSFKPLMGVNSEFAAKWMSLCDAHLGDVGIREPITCYEYLGNFYVQEGNKRVSVLRHFGSPRIPANVKRIMPIQSNDPRIKAYYEFLDFYKSTKLYCVQFRRPKDYDKLLQKLDRVPGEKWDDEDQKLFNSRFHYFQDAFAKANTKFEDILPEEALLLWLDLYPYSDLSRMTAAELNKSVAALWKDMVSTKKDAVSVEAKVEEGTKPSLLTRIISLPDHLNIAFIQQLSPANSGWAQGHERGKEHLEEVFGNKITVRSYYNANTTEAAAALIEQAIKDGAQVIFTTVPQMSKATLKAAVSNPKVFFFNCSVDSPYSSFRSYYGRIYEAKFITGAIAGAMSQNNRIGYIASYPIYGVPASINAFALGAQLTNPRAQIELRWSCCEGNHQADFFADGIRVVSNRDMPVQSKMYLDFCSYGTYLMNDRGDLIPLASPVWVWGKFYETVVKGIFAGTLKNDKSESARNYWLGMDSGVIDIDLSDKLPEGVRTLAKLLSYGIGGKHVDPFNRKIVAQDGSVKNQSGSTFTLDELIHMDWLCDNVIGSIPTYDEVLPMSQAMVRELGIFKDAIPVQKEGKKHEDPDGL